MLLPYQPLRVWLFYLWYGGMVPPYHHNGKRLLGRQSIENRNLSLVGATYHQHTKTSTSPVNNCETTFRSRVLGPSDTWQGWQGLSYHVHTNECQINCAMVPATATNHLPLKYFAHVNRACACVRVLLENLSTFLNKRASARCFFCFCLFFTRTNK